MWTVTTLQLGHPGKSTHLGGLGWSTIGLARSGRRIAILDTGGFSARRNVLGGLAAENLTPEDVTDLLLTHLHHDHRINWPLFPQATIHVAAAELAWALSLPPGQLTVPEAVPPPAKNPSPPEIPPLPGIKSFPTPGHTPHHVAFALDGSPPPSSPPIARKTASS